MSLCQLLVTCSTLLKSIELLLIKTRYRMTTVLISWRISTILRFCGRHVENSCRFFSASFECSLGTSVGHDLLAEIEISANDLLKNGEAPLRMVNVYGDKAAGDTPVKECAAFVGLGKWLRARAHPFMKHSLRQALVQVCVASKFSRYLRVQTLSC